MGTGRELLLRPVVIHHGRRCSGQKGRIERTAEGLHLAMERREVQGRGGTQEAQGEAKLPKWCGVRPGKKEGDPETPEGEEEAADDAGGDEEYDEEEEEYDEEEEEE